MKTQPAKEVYEQLYGKSLTTEQVAEMRYNVVKYVELLIQLDQQHKEWLKHQAQADKKEDNNK